MLLKTEPIEIPVASPFRDDALKREDFVKALTKMIYSVRQPFVLAVNSSYGTGKTTFIRMWRQHLENQGFRTLHFNAWENDFTENALISILGEFRQAVKAVKGGGENKFLACSLKIGRALGKNAFPAGARIAISAFPGGEKSVEVKCSPKIRPVA